MKNHSGEMLWPKIKDYIDDTINEASLEEMEHIFLEKTVKNSMELTKEGTVSISTAASKAIILFAKAFMPHCSRTNFWIQMKQMQRLKFQVNNEIKTMHAIRDNNSSKETPKLSKDRN